MPGNRTLTIGAARRRLLVGIATCALALMTVWAAFPAHAMAANTTAGGSWATFTDPTYGFSLRYPTSWRLVHGYAGGPTTFAHGTTGTTINPIVERQAGSVASLLNAAASLSGATVRRLTVDGVPAVDVTQTYTSGKAAFNPLGPAEVRTVTLAVANNSGATTTYSLQLTVRTDTRGQLSAAAQAEMATFEAMVQSFRLPSAAAAAAAATPHNPSPNNCPPWCWADKNWNYTIYSDNSNGRACPTAYNNCTYETLAPQWYYMPDFQCAEFVSRALAQGYGVPGLINGGQSGFGGTVTGHQGQGWDFGKYSMTTLAYNNQYGATDQFWLTDVGGAGNPSGLYDYLLSTGMGVDEGTNISGPGWIAGQGDVIFYYEGSSNFQHVMIVTDRYQSGNYIELIGDGHNVAEYRQDIADTNHLSGFHLVHINMDQQDGLTAYPTLSHTGTGPSWSSTQYDGWGVAFNYTSMWSGSETASANLSWSGNTFTSCGIAAFVPNSNYASAIATFSVELANGTFLYYTVNENNNLYGGVVLIKPNAVSSPPISVYVDNHGSSGGYLGVGQFYYFC